MQIGNFWSAQPALSFFSDCFPVSLFVTQYFSPTTLHEACQEGDFGSAFKFVVDGADVNAQDSDGKTPLYHAVKVSNDKSPYC